MTVQDATVNYTWDLPQVNGSSGVWGEMLNVIIGDDVTGIDAVVKAVSDVADAALPVDGTGAMTGVLTSTTQTFVPADGSDFSSSLDLGAANYFYGTAVGAQTIAFSNIPTTGKVVFVVLEITDGGTLISWPAGAVWPGGSAPTTLTVSGTDIVTAFTRDAGTTWYFTLAQEDVA